MAGQNDAALAAALQAIAGVVGNIPGAVDAGRAVWLRSSERTLLLLKAGITLMVPLSG